MRPTTPSPTRSTSARCPGAPPWSARRRQPSHRAPHLQRLLAGPGGRRVGGHRQLPDAERRGDRLHGDLRGGKVGRLQKVSTGGAGDGGPGLERGGFPRGGAAGLEPPGPSWPRPRRSTPDLDQPGPVHRRARSRPRVGNDSDIDRQSAGDTLKAGVQGAPAGPGRPFSASLSAGGHCLERRPPRSLSHRPPGRAARSHLGADPGLPPGLNRQQRHDPGRGHGRGGRPGRGRRRGHPGRPAARRGGGGPRPGGRGCPGPAEAPPRLSPPGREKAKAHLNPSTSTHAQPSGGGDQVRAKSSGEGERPGAAS